LNTLAEQRTTSVEEKRSSFQKRPRDDWRTRTQPVTIEELEEAEKNKRTHEVQLHVRVYTYDFRRGVVTDN
jgi:hypothetical protein